MYHLCSLCTSLRCCQQVKDHSSGAQLRRKCPHKSRHKIKCKTSPSFKIYHSSFVPNLFLSVISPSCSCVCWSEFLVCPSCFVLWSFPCGSCVTSLYLCLLCDGLPRPDRFHLGHVNLYESCVLRSVCSYPFCSFLKLFWADTLVLTLGCLSQYLNVVKRCDI